MLPEIGHTALLFAFAICLVNACAPLLVDLKALDRIFPGLDREAVYASAPRLVFGQFFFISLAFVFLGMCFLLNDFSVSYVASHSNTLLPVRYKLSAIWGGHEGSLLLWVWILAAWTFLLALNMQSLHTRQLAKTLAVLSWVSLGFLAFILFTSNPFYWALPYFPLDGQDLNPLLQDFGLIVHPPMLYMGYVGFAVPFAFAVAGLLEGEFTRHWAARSRPWAKAAWAFLGIGIALGSWWAYYELGWGGWWFWDPVENASFLPWLAGAALLHSLLVCEKRDGFRVWTVLLSIIVFSLSLLGTFLVRSGVLTSVHAFASDPSRGLFILVFLALVVGLSLLLFFIRAGKLQTDSEFGFLSREFFLILNNIFLLVACSTVLLGTLFPIISDVLNLGKISVGPPYFNSLFFPLTILLLICFAIVPALNWRQTKVESFRLPALVALAVAIPLAAAYIYGVYSVWNWKLFLLLALIFCSLIMLSVSLGLSKPMKLVENWKRMPISRKNMHIAHFGFLVALFGIGLTSVYSEERDVSLAAGDTIEIAEHRFSFRGIDQRRGPNYLATRGTVDVETPYGRRFTLEPEKRKYFMQEKPMTEAAINPGFTRDIYVALGEDLGANKWSLRIYHKPFVRLIWLGALIMSLSCLFYVFRTRFSRQRA